MIGDEDLNDNDVSHLLDLAVILLQVKFEVSSRLSRFNRLPLVHLHCLQHRTVATCHWDPSLSKWGPNGDPIFSEMGTKWGPSAAEWGPKKQMFAKLSETR